MHASRPRDELSRSELDSQVHYRIFERLAASEHRYRALVDGIRDPVFQCDTDERLVFVNHGWTRLLGHDGKACLGRSLAEFIAPTEHQRLASLMGARTNATSEFEFRHRDGARVIADLSLSYVPDEGWVGTLHDSTARHEVHMQLERAKQAVEAADRLKGEFIANLSHEIRTPLGAVVGFATLLAGQEIPRAELPDLTHRIRSNADRLLRTIEDTLEMSQLLAGRTEIADAPCDPRALVEDIGAYHADEARVRGLAWEVRVAPDVPALCVTDPMRVRQVLLRLAGNALKFTESGGAELAVNRSPDGTSIEFAVSDSGPGLTSEELVLAREPFRQTDGSSTRRFGGLGLGLTVASGLAERLGGTLLARSERGRGSTFTLRIPFRPARVDRPPPTTGAADAMPPRMSRVLLVEDTEDMAQLAERLLTRLGVAVVLARNGAQGLEMAMHAMHEGQPYDLVLMDMQMPVMDGYRATEALRACGYGGPIVALTAHGLPQDRARCRAAGCDDHVAKPIEKAALRRVLARYAPGSESTKESPTPSSRA